MLPFTKQSPIVRLGECFKTSSITSQRDKFKSPLMLVQSNLADSGSTGSKNVCFGGRNHLQGKGNNTKRQHSGYFLNCSSQSQNNPLLHLCTKIILFKKVSEGHSYLKKKKKGIMEGSNTSHFSFIHYWEKEIDVPHHSQHERVQTCILYPFL